MRTRILVDRYEMEFEGPAGYWNECLRGIFGGPAAEETAVSETTPDPEPASATAGDENGASPAPPPPARAEKPARPAPPAAPATDTDLLYADLAKVGGRRAEKDAVLATVWLLGGTQHDVTFDDVARRMRTVERFRDARVKPLLLKHCSRSHMLEPGAERETVRMTKKGIRYIAGLMG